MIKARLLTASCTTGWGDWIHGELWLLPDALVRVRNNLLTTIAHQNRPTVPNEPVVHEFDEGELERLVRGHKTNLWIPADQIVAADLRKGVLSSRLSLALADGRRIKLLWLARDPAAAPLKDALESWGVSV